MTVALAHSFSSSLYDMHGRTSSLLQNDQVQRLMVHSERDDHLPELASVRDRVSISRQGMEAASDSLQEHSASGETRSSGGHRDHGPDKELTAEEEKTVARLQARDREVKAHEQAHLAHAGRYAAGGARYSWQTGPDGRRYAVGGEVPIDLSEEPEPEQTIRKMQVVRRAALAPAQPSAADRTIAATATQKEARARQELRADDEIPASGEQRISPQQEKSSNSLPGDPSPPQGRSRISIMA